VIGGRQSVDALRSAIRRAQEDGASLHALSAVTGLSASGLLKFLRGADPRPSTLRKLSRWYLSASPPRDDLAMTETRELLRLIMPGIRDESSLDTLLQGMAGMAQVIYRSQHTDPPRWILEALRQTEP